jgi:hypothetical protein
MRSGAKFEVLSPGKSTYIDILKSNRGRDGTLDSVVSGRADGEVVVPSMVTRFAVELRSTRADGDICPYSFRKAKYKKGTSELVPFSFCFRVTAAAEPA